MPFLRAATLAVVVTCITVLASGVAVAQAPATGQAAPSSFVVCVPNSAGNAVAPCGADGSATMPTVQVGYLLTPAEYSAFFQSTQPLDPADLAAFWSYGCMTVIGCWFGSYAIGLVLRQLR